MDELDRNVAGLRCRDVLEHLSAYVDGELAPALVRQVHAHLGVCDRCERFGGRFAQVLVALRREFAPPEELRPEVEERLRSRLQEV